MDLFNAAKVTICDGMSQHPGEVFPFSRYLKVFVRVRVSHISAIDSSSKPEDRFMRSSTQQVRLRVIFILFLAGMTWWSIKWPNLHCSFSTRQPTFPHHSFSDFDIFYPHYFFFQTQPSTLLDFYFEITISSSFQVLISIQYKNAAGMVPSYLRVLHRIAEFWTRPWNCPRAWNTVSWERQLIHPTTRRAGYHSLPTTNANFATLCAAFSIMPLYIEYTFQQSVFSEFWVLHSSVISYQVLYI